MQHFKAAKMIHEKLITTDFTPFCGQWLLFAGQLSGKMYQKNIYISPAPKKVMMVVKTPNIVQWTFERNEK